MQFPLGFKGLKCAVKEKSFNFHARKCTQGHALTRANFPRWNRFQRSSASL
jgi:hypothetical protein